MTHDPYQQFLASKIAVAPACGLQVSDDEINPLLKPHQRDAVRWALAGGRRALFEAFGLGKSIQQLEILRLIREKVGGPVGIVMPLGVRQEFKRDAYILATGDDAKVTDEQRATLRAWWARQPHPPAQVRFVRAGDEVDPAFAGIHLTNYESVRDGKLDPNVFTAASLDEASVLRSFGSKTYQTFLTLFDRVRFRFVATATPSPNRYKELIHYAGFLGVMDTGQALTRWFKRDSTKANNLTLLPSKEREFWLWVASWALFLQRPSDLGYSDDGYDLPPLTVHYVEVPVDHATAEPDRDGQGNLFRDAALGVRDAAREKRETLPARVAAVRSIIDQHPDDHWLVWHDLEAERHALQAAIPDAVSVYGEQSKRGLEQHICLARDSRVLTKERGYVPIQDVRVGEHTLTHMGRWRPVLAVRKTADSADVVTLRAQGVPGITLTPTHKVWTRRVSGKKRERDAAENATPEWVPAADVEGDYVNLKLPPVADDGSVDGRTWWIVGRWLADGHRDAHGAAVISCGRHEVDDLLSVLGDLAAEPVDTGTAIQIRLRDPRGELRRILDECGRGATGKHLPPRAFTLSKDNAGELLNGYLAGDGHYNPMRQRWSASSVSRDLLLGIAVLAQRVHGTVPTLYAGRVERRGVIQGREVQMRQDWILSFDDVAKASRKRPFILDDGAWKKVSSVTPAGQAETWNLHVAEDNSYTAEGLIVKNCPLQFDIVDRLITRYSNPGELVYDPFGGLFTVPYRALKLGRKGRAAELNTAYFLDGVKYLEAAERELAMPTLFDTLDPVDDRDAA